MGVYDNINGTMVRIAPNIRVQNSPVEQYVTEAELVEGLSTKQDVIQYNTLPTASEDNLGKVVQYIGTTNANYTHGYFYECVSDGQTTPTYSWVNVRVEDSIQHYDTMPSDAEILEMSNNTIFFTKGFYDVYDGFGGYYLVSSTVQRGALKIEGTSSNKYLTALDTNGRYMEYIEACRYGIRPYTDTIDFSTITKSNTYADINSDIISRIYLPTNKATLKFGVGKFFFADTINIDGTHRQLNIKGELVGTPNTSRNNRYSSDASQGTALYFPFLENGEYGIISHFGNIENVCIVGNPLTYDIAFDRTKAITAPNEVVTETVAQSSGSDIQCTAIYKESSTISNVVIMNFYTAIENSRSNIYMHDIHVRYCHNGFKLKSDNKCRGLYGADVHTFITIDGSLVSVQQGRVDSCVNAVKLINGNGIVLNDIDGDWCTDSLIVVGEEGSSTGISEGTFTALKGRCCTLKGATTPVDARDLADTSGYGIIRLVSGTFKDNTIQISSIGNRNISDTSSTYKTPYIILTYVGDGTTTVIENTRFIINEGSYVNSIDDIRKIYQPRSGGYNYEFSIATSKETYYITKTQLRISPIQCVNMPTAKAQWLGYAVQYIGTTGGGYTHNATYECISDGASTPTYSWKLVEIPLNTLQSVVAASSDFADFQTRIAAL